MALAFASGGGGGSSVSWQTFAPATTGISGASGTSRYAQDGKVVVVALDTNGTSTATTKTITLPVTPANIAGIQWVGMLVCADNTLSLATPGEIVVNPNNATASLFKDTKAGAWTAAGSWFCIGTVIYESA